MDWAPIFSLLGALGGAYLGSTLSYWGQRKLTTDNYARERRALAHGLAGEIEGYLKLMERRKHIEHVEEFLASGRPIDLRLLTDPSTDDMEPFAVMKANLVHIGRLVEVSDHLGYFYALVSGVRTTIAQAHRGQYDGYTEIQKRDLVQEELNVWKEAIKIGANVVENLRRIES